MQIYLIVYYFFYEAKSFLTLAAIFSAIINVILNAIFIPKFGFVAAAYTTLASYLILAILDYVYMRVICKKKKYRSRPLQYKRLGSFSCNFGLYWIFGYVII
ncbi:MAG: polysaccharide biosynthesis C-terminal domain-containing protein [Waltera sp.]